MYIVYKCKDHLVHSAGPMSSVVNYLDIMASNIVEIMLDYTWNCVLFAYKQLN